MPNSSSPTSVRLCVCPVSALVDDPVHITATGLKSFQKITIQALLEEDGVKFGSSGHYISDQNGDVDLKTDASHGGSYDGIEPMGLFWSKKLIPNQRSGYRLLKKDVTLPLRDQLYIREGHVPWEKLWTSPPATLATAEALRYYLAEDVKRTEIEHGRVRGTLFLPPGKGPFPGVIDLFGSAGGLLEFRASLLASRGFATFALAFFNYKDLPPNLQDIDLEYFMEAVEWFCSLSEVQPKGIGVGGVSKGGELSLLMAAYCHQISACVNINGPPHVSGAQLKFGDTYLPGASMQNDRLIFTDEGIRIADSLVYERDHVIPFGRSRAKFLVILGEDDGGYNCERIQREISLLPESKQRDIEVIKYPGAGHLIEPPYAPHTRTAYYSILGKVLRTAKGMKEGDEERVLVVWGGETKAHSVAQEHSWSRIIQFYRDHVGYNSQQQNSKL